LVPWLTVLCDGGPICLGKKKGFVSIYSFPCRGSTYLPSLVVASAADPVVVGIAAIADRVHNHVVDLVPHIISLEDDPVRVLVVLQ
jgi:hypothetical protein